MNEQNYTKMQFVSEVLIDCDDGIYCTRYHHNRVGLFVKVAGFIINFATQFKGILS